MPLRSAKSFHINLCWYTITDILRQIPSSTNKFATVAKSESADSGHFSFRRFGIDGKHTFHPFNRPEDILTIHDRLTISDTSNGNVVPFYMQETLGGSDINGQPTLRGFADYRFRAPDLMLIQVEYDRRIWGP